MRHRAWLRIAVGIVLLVLAVCAAFLAGGVGEAANAFRHSEASWQRGLRPTPPAAPRKAQRAGEVLLGIDGRSDVLRAYENYRAGLANVIPGTVFPQTQARWDALEQLRRLRSSLTTDEDRASADVVLGVIFVASAGTAGQQRGTQTKYALDAFRRAVLEDPANDSAKLDLELVLSAEQNRSQARAEARARASANRRRQRQQDPRGPIRAAPTGTGY
jgi:hypothetical protein